MKTILEKAELKGDHIYINDELVATKNMIRKNGEDNAKRIVDIINMHDEMLEALKEMNVWAAVNFPEHGMQHEFGTCASFNKMRAAINKATK